jgi:hypothetical protein
MQQIRTQLVAPARLMGRGADVVWQHGRRVFFVREIGIEARGGDAWLMGNQILV